MSRVETLLAAMTLEEKIGQLNMATADRVVTGPVLPGDTEAGIRSGRIGWSWPMCNSTAGPGPTAPGLAAGAGGLFPAPGTRLD